MISASHPAVSIIFGTFNRLALLQDAVASIRSSIGPYSYEIVITDGGSTDGSLQWMASQPDIVIAETGNLKGAVSAFNAAWQATRGEVIANFNDDAQYVDDCLAQGVQALTADKAGRIGQVAFELDAGGSWHIADFYGSGLWCANFGIGHRGAIEEICIAQGSRDCYWNPIYHTYAGDCEHSAWAWNLGFKVLALRGARVHDRPAKDELRDRNLKLLQTTHPDDVLFKERWPRAGIIRVESLRKQHHERIGAR